MWLRYTLTVKGRGEFCKGTSRMVDPHSLCGLGAVVRFGYEQLGLDEDICPIISSFSVPHSRNHSKCGSLRVIYLGQVNRGVEMAAPTGGNERLERAL